MPKTKKRAKGNTILSNNSLKSFIESLRIISEQKKFLLDELPKMDKKERVELLEMLANVYALNQEEDETLKRLKDNWE